MDVQNELYAIIKIDLNAGLLCAAFRSILILLDIFNIRIIELCNNYCQ